MNIYHYEFGGKGSFLTNFDSEDILHYKMAIYEYERSGKANKKFWIENDAFDCRNQKLKNVKALHVSNINDCSDFWRIFDAICKDIPTEFQSFLYSIRK